jgi:hypothetical protein
MVELAVIQSVSSIASTLGVLLGVIYYVNSLKETNKNRRASLTNTLMNSFLSEEGMKRWHDLEIMTWKDFEDYYRKYDSTVNPENYVKRQSFWNTCDLIGYQYREGLVDLNTVSNAGGIWIMASWLKFKPIIEAYRKTEYAMDEYENYEYVANELLKMKQKKDPLYTKKVKEALDRETSASNP